MNLEIRKTIRHIVFLGILVALTFLMLLTLKPYELFIVTFPPLVMNYYFFLTSILRIYNHTHKFYQYLALAIYLLSFITIIYYELKIIPKLILSILSILPYMYYETT